MNMLDDLLGDFEAIFGDQNLRPTPSAIKDLQRAAEAARSVLKPRIPLEQLMVAMAAAEPHFRALHAEMAAGIAERQGEMGVRAADDIRREMEKRND